MSPEDRILVAGAGGFIGGHFVRYLLDRGFSRLRAVDFKPVKEWYQHFPQTETLVMDLRDRETCLEVVDGCGTVLNLASDMGGMGFIENNKALCMLSVLINTHLLMASREHRVDKYFYASSACVYSAEKQSRSDAVALKEADAYPAMPEDGYGWEKLFGERMCRHFYEDFGLEIAIARFHNVYGSHGTWTGGREKAPAAICRKVAEAVRNGSHEIEVWGDGEQTRSFTYIGDCLRGIELLIHGDYPEPVNVGSSELVTVNQLVDIIEEIAGVRLNRRYRLDAPLGVRGRNSDNTLIRRLFGWEPNTPLKDGMAATYTWIQEQIAAEFE